MTCFNLIQNWMHVCILYIIIVNSVLFLLVLYIGRKEKDVVVIDVQCAVLFFLYIEHMGFFSDNYFGI